MSEQLGFTFQAVRRIWTVRDLMSAVRTHTEREFTDVWLEGEISNFRPADSGHLYFTLKDDDAQIRVVMFRSQARLMRFRPENGLQVIVRGRVTVYEARGELQLSAEYLEPRGAGALQIAFEQLKAKLAAEGLFDSERKRAIPALPRRIGVVTSPRGAAIQDILNVLRRRHEDVRVLIYPAQVQGEAAPAEVSAGLRYFNRTAHVDVIIVARGGGSIEDLAAFNDEALARTVVSSKIPVISAVGHETDFTIIDFVADLRAPTPSAAAELVVRSKHEIEEKLEHLHRRLGRAARFQLLRARQLLTDIAQQVALARMADLIARRQQRIDELVFRLAHAQSAWLHAWHRRLDAASARVRHHDLRQRFTLMRRQLENATGILAAVARARVGRQRASVDQLAGRLQALSPTNILQRGYALVFDRAGNLVKDAAQLNTGDEITAQLGKGKIEAVVKSRRAP